MSDVGHGSTLTAPRTRHRRLEAVILTLLIVAVTVAMLCLAALCVLLIVGIA